MKRKTPNEIVSESAAALEKLRASEIKYRTLFESANDGIFLMMRDKFVDCNQKFLEIFGCSREQIIGQTPYMFSPPFQPDGRMSKEKAIEKGKAAIAGAPQFFEWRHCRYDGTLFDTEVSLNRIEIDQETVLLQAIVRDVTQRKKAEEELKVKSLNLEEVNAALRVLLNQREQDRSEMEGRILDNVRKLVLPYIGKLKTKRLDEEQTMYVDILETNLQNIVSPFVQKMTSAYSSFTPGEILVANLIRDGRTIKEIASVSGVSENAVNRHRQNIRNKLGLNRRKVNLRAYLMSLS